MGGWNDCRIQPNSSLTQGRTDLQPNFIVETAAWRSLAVTPLTQSEHRVATRFIVQHDRAGSFWFRFLPMALSPLAILFQSKVNKKVVLSQPSLAV